MEQLEQHRKRITAKRAALERLLDLHARLYELRHTMVAVGKVHADDREQRLRELREQVDALVPEVELLQEQLGEKPSKEPKKEPGE